MVETLESQQKAKNCASFLINGMEEELKRQDDITKYERFNKWCKEVGIRAPKLEYPAFFKSGLCGVRVTGDIAHNEAMFSIPFKCILTCQKARQQPQLAKVFRQHPNLFDEDENSSWQHYMLMALLFFEMQKGEDSFWYPYLQILPNEAKSFWRWDPQIIKQTQDPALIVQRPRKTKMYQESLQGALKVFRMHPEVFDQRLITEENVSKVEAWVDTRIFGSNNLPYCALIPFADNLNHSDIWI